MLNMLNATFFVFQGPPGPPGPRGPAGPSGADVSPDICT